MFFFFSMYDKFWDDLWKAREKQWAERVERETQERKRWQFLSEKAKRKELREYWERQIAREAAWSFDTEKAVAGCREIFDETTERGREASQIINDAIDRVLAKGGK